MKLISSFLLCLLISITLYSQNRRPNQKAVISAAGSSFSQKKLNYIDSLLNKSIDQKLIPGAVVLVSKKGKIVYEKAFGYADNLSDRKMKTDDIFRIASMTKAITSTAILMLHEEGHFLLDDPISNFIPEFKKPMVLDSFIESDSSFIGKPANKEITFRHLLTHTSGLGYGAIDGNPKMKAIYKKAGIVDLFTTSDVKIADNIKQLAKLPLHHHPGEKYTYSEGLDVAGYLIEIISGLPFDLFLQKRIFEPLGMRDTYFYLPESKASRLVKVQTKRENQWVHFTDTFYDVDYPIKGSKIFLSGGAGLSSTARDYAKFLQMYLNKGLYNGKQFLSSKTIASAMTNQVKELRGQYANETTGLAFGIVTKHGESISGLGSEGTFTWGGYFNTHYFADPKEQLIGIILKQTQGVNDKNNSARFRALAIQSID
jgi:CubicO group peptidase (beta-lactamase class C family)